MMHRHASELVRKKTSYITEGVESQKRPVGGVWARGDVARCASDESRSEGVRDVDLFVPFVEDVDGECVRMGDFGADAEESGSAGGSGHLGRL